jgi:hypothetical protein
MPNINTNNEDADKSESGTEILSAQMSPEQQIKMKMRENINQLRVYWNPSDIKELEGSVKQLQALLESRIKRKRAIVIALRQGNKPPMDFNPADSTIRQSYQKFEMSSAKYLTLKGWTPAYRELMKNMDDYVAEKRTQIKVVDATIKDIKSEKGKRSRDKTEEDKIRKMLSEKKAA